MAPQNTLNLVKAPHKFCRLDYTVIVEVKFKPGLTPSGQRDTEGLKTLYFKYSPIKLPKYYDMSGVKCKLQYL